MRYDCNETLESTFKPCDGSRQQCWHTGQQKSL